MPRKAEDKIPTVFLKEATAGTVPNTATPFAAKGSAGSLPTADGSASALVQ
jgi:hypothetical protein